MEESRKKIGMKLLVITQRVDIDHDIMGFFNNWIKRIAPLVDEVNVIAVAVGRTDLPDNVKVYSLESKSNTPKIIKYFNFYKYLIRVLPRVDGIFVHMCPEYILASYPLNLIFRKPIIMWYAHVRVSGLAKWAAKRAKKILSPSGHSFLTETDKLLGTGHGIDMDIFKPGQKKSDDNKKSIVTISRISYIKEYEVLVEAMNILVNKFNRTDFVAKIAGEPSRPEDTEYLENLKSKIRDYNIEEYFEWFGAIANRDTVEFYQNADIFARMQPGGGFGKSELEALACGVPAVLCTDVYEEAFGRFQKDLYWHEKDADEFAKKIIAVSEWTDDDRREYGERVREFVKENHNLEKLAEKIINQFNLILTK